MTNTGNVLHGFLSDIGIVPNEKERAVVSYGGQKVTLCSFKRLTGTKWLNDEVINLFLLFILPSTIAKIYKRWENMTLKWQKKHAESH